MSFVVGRRLPQWLLWGSVLALCACSDHSPLSPSDGVSFTVTNIFGEEAVELGISLLEEALSEPLLDPARLELQNQLRALMRLSARPGEPDSPLTWASDGGGQDLEIVSVLNQVQTNGQVFMGTYVTGDWYQVTEHYYDVTTSAGGNWEHDLSAMNMNWISIWTPDESACPEEETMSNSGTHIAYTAFRVSSVSDFTFNSNTCEEQAT